MQYLKMIPLFGWGMMFFEFIFMAQKWASDEARMTQSLLRAKSVKHSLWLIIFPEGTLNTPGNVDKSYKFAQKVSLSLK
jgi:lysocardiolipin and lysophospholipid acyltransferase